MNKDTLSGHLRARVAIFGGVVLQVGVVRNGRLFWKDAKPKDVNLGNLTVNFDKVIGGDPMTEEELSALKVTQAEGKRREKEVYERARELNSVKIIKKLRAKLEAAALEGRLLRASVEPKGPFDMKKIQAAFPNLCVYGNSNECGSDEFSIDIEEK